MKEYTTMLKIHGVPTESQVFVDASGKEWVRYMAEGCWAPQSISKTSEHIFVKTNGDGSISAIVQQLISSEKSSDEQWLEEQMNRMLNGIESTLGLDINSLYTASNWIGHSSEQFDSLMGEFDSAVVAGKTVQALMPLNTFANVCGYFFNHCLDPRLCDHEVVNNGYNCSHPEQKEGEDGIGSCFAWSCPLCYSSDGVSCAKCGMECEECEECGREECECEDDYVVAVVPESLFNESKMNRIPNAR